MLQPAAAARPEHETVGGDVRVRVRGEERVVLRPDLAPGEPHAGRGPGAVREHRLEVRVPADLRARVGELDAGPLRGRQLQHARAAVPHALRRVDGDVERPRLGARPVARVGRQGEERPVVRRRAGAPLDGERADPVRHAHAERMRRAHLEVAAGGDADLAVAVLRVRPHGGRPAAVGC